MKLGVFLFNLGGPETLNDVRPFLYNLFSDPEIIRLPRPAAFLRKPLAWLIATARQRKSSDYYRQIGGGSPLRRITEEQAAALRRELTRQGTPADVFAGMRAWKPSFEEAADTIEKSGVECLIVLPLFPQYSVSTTGSGFAYWRQLTSMRPRLQAMEMRWVDQWCDQPVYIDAFSSAIRRELLKFPAPGSVHILFSAHSVPESYIRRGDPYLDQTRRTIDAIMDRLGRTIPHRLAFQSKIGPVKWLEPFTNKAIVELASEGVTQILVVPVSFVSEHIETLYELDILYRKVAADAGVTHFRRVPALNDDPAFIRALAGIVRDQIGR